MSKQYFILHGTLTPVELPMLAAALSRVEELEARVALMRESMLEMVGRMADRGIVERAYEALGDPKPPARKLKGKIPRYQQELIDAGKLAD